METGRMFINNEWVLADSGKTREIRNPASGELVGIVAEGGVDEVRRAAKAAYDARLAWGRTSYAQRAALMKKFADIYEARTDELVKLENSYTGTLLKNVRVNVATVANMFRYYAGIMGSPSGYCFNGNDDLTTISMLEPIGVCGLIIPWNGPISILSKCLAPALAAGNTVVVKPSSITPLGTIAMFECLEQAGFPKGVVNLVLGNGEVIGKEMGENELIGKVALTGGTDTGKSLIRASAGNVKRLSLELGGKSPILVYDDADLACAVDNCMTAMFNNAGQVCVAGSRLYVQDGIYDKFVEMIVEKTKKIKVGMPDDPASEMGPVISKTQVERILGYIDIGVKEGAKLACGGHAMKEGAYANGNFIEPTIFVDCNNSMRIVREEIFGPVMVICRFETDEEAYELANDSVYGLAAAAFTSSSARAWRFAKRVKAATMWVNAYGPSASTDATIYCCKQSGYSALMGKACIESYMDPKRVTFKVEPTMTKMFKG